MKQIFYFVAILLLFSCERDQLPDESTRPDGAITFNQYSSGASFRPNYWDISDIGTVVHAILNDSLIYPNDLYDLSNAKLGGETVSIKFAENTDTFDFYIPQPIVLTSPKITPSGQLDSSVPITLEWEADIVNPNPILIKIQWKNKTVYKKYIEDNGKYTLEDKLFAEIPKMTNIDIILLREHFIRTTDNYHISAYVVLYLPVYR